MLGPVRFNHIETCAREACHTFRLKDEVEELVATLRSLDDILTALRTEFASLRQLHNASEGSSSANRKPPDYDALIASAEVDKAKRLIAAREKAIKSVKLGIQKLKPKDPTVGGSDLPTSS